MISIPFIEAHVASIFLKFIFATLFLLCYLWVLHRILNDKELRKLFIQSISDDAGRISGKSISACAFVNILILGWVIAIYYDEHHLAPEYYFWGIVSLIGGMYGLREYGKYASKKLSAINETPIVSTENNQANQENTSEEKKD